MKQVDGIVLTGPIRQKLLYHLCKTYHDKKQSKYPLSSEEQEAIEKGLPLRDI
jgi:hypothetical protein